MFNQETRKIILLLGGARSGKSSYAEQLAKGMAKKVLFVATAEAGDEDMRFRIQKHQQARPSNWRTLEATCHIGKWIEDKIEDEDLVIIDCITMLVSNIFCQLDASQFENIQDSILEKQVTTEIQELKECLRKIKASFIIISNEVGLGLVPDNRMGRLYRDILGRANQMLAQNANEVYFMVAGIPLIVKTV
jgi:adenosylcobinamide kinase / adenosylcobinamide-phosphate guanylyltransferase